MQPFDSFVQSTNVDRYLDQLAAEGDHVKRTTLLKLLVEEEDKLGRNREELVKAERRVSDGKHRLQTLSSVATGLVESGRNINGTVTLLVTMQDTQRLLERHYRKLCDELGET